jgi:hypothetical protein
MFKLLDSKNNQISNYIKEMTISYDDKYIGNPVRYSNCIQYDGTNIYIPTKDGFFTLK